jgi:hypothetical protein
MSHSPTTRYVVLSWTRTGSNPELAVDRIFPELIDAGDLARDMTAEAKRECRTDSYTVHEVNMDVETY